MRIYSSFTISNCYAYLGIFPSYVYPFIYEICMQCKYFCDYCNYFFVFPNSNMNYELYFYIFVVDSDILFCPTSNKRKQLKDLRIFLLYLGKKLLERRNLSYKGQSVSGSPSCDSYRTIHSLMYVYVTGVTDDYKIGHQNSLSTLQRKKYMLLLHLIVIPFPI